MRTIVYILAGLLLCQAVAHGARADDQPSGSDYNWRQHWSLGPGLKVELDTEGYQYPTSIAFVPEPGDAPDDPLYYVVELRGKVKVVSNDRTVSIFADNFLQSEFDREPPDGTAEFGAGGICLDPEHGYVFVTFTYQDAAKILRNNIIRFAVEPGRFSLAPAGQAKFTELFLPFKSGVSHQIGPCQVQGENLFVSVGDGFDTPFGSQALDTLLGKILRLTLDGKAAPGNPFYEEGWEEEPEAYIWAYGLRNPFSLKALPGRLFLADNGLASDRFLEVDAGRNYLWDGTERSIGINVPAVIFPSVGPVQMDYLPEAASHFTPADRDKFYVALSGKVAGIMTFDYNMETRLMRRAPSFFMQAIGGWRQMMTGLAFGPDGLYFTPLLPDPDGRSPVLRIVSTPDDPTPGNLLENPNPWTLIYQRGCYGCHKLGNVVRGAAVGPPLDQEPLIAKLQEDLNTPGYLASLDEIDQLDEEPQSRFRQARQEVREAQGIDRIRVWMRYRIHEPRFDRVSSKMPNMNVSLAEAERLTTFLLGLGKKPPPSWRSRVKAWLPRDPVLALKFTLVGFVAGCAAALAGLAVFRRRRPADQEPWAS